MGRGVDRTEWGGHRPGLGMVEWKASLAPPREAWGYWLGIGSWSGSELESPVNGGIHPSLPSWSFLDQDLGPVLLMFSSFCLLPFAGHKDSVTCAGFSHDSTLVATGDMSGLLKVWQVDTKEEVWSFEAGDLEVR